MPFAANFFPLLDMEIQGSHRGEFSGRLEKRSRRRDFFTADNWKPRDFRLLGQSVSYFDDSGRECGSFSVKDTKTFKVKPEDLQGREHAFALQLAALTLPDGSNQQEENVFLVAPDESTRSKWISVINAASISKNWMVSNHVVQAKTGADIALTLLKKRDESKADFIAGYVISSNFKHRQAIKEYDLELESTRNAISNIKKQYGGGKVDYEMLKKLHSRLDEVRRMRAIASVQYQVRVFLARRKLREKERAHIASRKLTMLFRLFCARRKLRKAIKREHAMKVVRRLVVRYLAHFRKKRNRKRKPQTFSLDLINAKHLIGVEDLRASVYVYTMSCIDKAGTFKGTEARDIKDGYGLISCCLHESVRQLYSHDPVWEDEEADEDLRKRERCYVLNTTEDCYIIVTLMAESSINVKSKSFLGQAIVRISDHKRRLYDREKAVTFRDVPLMRYVAPVEDPDGVSPFPISSALRVKKVTGSVSFRLKLVRPIDCYRGEMDKISNSKLAPFWLSSEHAYKTRYFVLIHSLLYYNKYNKNQKLLSNGNTDHCLNLEKVISLRTGESAAYWTIELMFQLNLDGPTKKWQMFLYKDKVSRKCFKTWVRRLYRGCTELKDPEITNLESSDVKLACKDLNHRIQERVDARGEMWNGRKQEDVLREIRGVAAVSMKEESKEEDNVASKGKKEKESGFFKRFVNSK